MAKRRYKSTHRDTEALSINERRVMTKGIGRKGKFGWWLVQMTNSQQRRPEWDWTASYLVAERRLFVGVSFHNIPNLCCIKQSNIWKMTKTIPMHWLLDHLPRRWCPWSTSSFEDEQFGESGNCKTDEQSRRGGHCVARYENSTYMKRNAKILWKKIPSSIYDNSAKGRSFRGGTSARPKGRSRRKTRRTRADALSGSDVSKKWASQWARW